MKNKIPAFTIMELIVVMIISIITISIFYTVYRIINKQFFDYSNKEQTISGYLHLKTALMQDFKKADSVMQNGIGNTIVCYIKADTIHYSFLEKSISRNTDKFSDSFSLPSFDMEIEKVIGKNLVKNVSFKTTILNDTILTDIVKEYDAVILIK